MRTLRRCHQFCFTSGYGKFFFDLSYPTQLARSGHPYTATIIPKKSYPDLQITKPQAKIGVYPAKVMTDMSRKLLSTLLPTLLFLGGLALTLAG